MPFPLTFNRVAEMAVHHCICGILRTLNLSVNHLSDFPPRYVKMGKEGVLTG